MTPRPQVERIYTRDPYLNCTAPRPRTYHARPRPSLKMAAHDREAEEAIHVDDIDLISSLPPELFLKITQYLSVPDVLKCVRVCRNWNECLTLPDMSFFWRRACRYAGLPDYYLKKNTTTNPHALFHATRLHLKEVEKLTPEIKPIVGSHPFESTTKCEYAGSGMFVKSIDYSSLDKKETVIGELCPEKQTIVKRDTFVGDHGPITWTAMIGDNVVWQTQDCHWFRYNLKNHSFHKMFTIRMARSMGDTIGHCRHCMFVLLAETENTMHGYSWLFNFIKLESFEDTSSPMRQKVKVPIPPGITQFIPRPVRAHLVPDDGDCSSHRLVIQGGTGGCVFKVTHKGPDGIKLSPKPIGTMNPFFDSDAAVMVVNTTSEMVLSQDETLVGMVTSVVYPFASGLCLHMFDMDTCERVVSVQVEWKEGYNDAEILTFSRLYAVLGVGHSKGVVKVVNPRNGKIVLTRGELSHGLPPVIPMARLLFIHYQGAYKDNCLVDVQSPFNLTIVYRKGTNNMEGLYFHPFPEKPYPGTGIVVEEESEDDRGD